MLHAGWAGQLLMKIRNTLEKSTKNCLPWEGPHHITEKTPLPRQIEERFLEAINLLKPPYFVFLHCQWERKKGWGVGGRRKVF